MQLKSNMRRLRNNKLFREMCCILIGCLAGGATSWASTRDFTYFINRLRTVNHLPELENSHTAMSSTWDRTGGNKDGNDFKQVEGNRNILFDADGPGCIHRIFTGVVDKHVDGTNIQIYLDHQQKPLFDMPVKKFFNYETGPFPYPLVFHKTYPGTLFPIPFAQHCKIVLVNEQAKNWGNYWQVTWTRYSPDTKIKSLSWPLSPSERKELEKTVKTWLTIESTAPLPPEQWTVERKLAFPKGKTHEIKLDGTGIIREMRIRAWPRSSELLNGIRMKIYWDGLNQPSVDAPLGYFFGHGDYKLPYATYYNTLVLGAVYSWPGIIGYTRFPMPYSKGAILRFENNSEVDAEELTIQLDIEDRQSLPSDFGRFHTTWTEKQAHSPDSPKYNGNNVHTVLERTGTRGKYVGVYVQIHWPRIGWWGEGDWLIWTDENGWPPSYHGTGSEEYFNSGWGSFDRKAVSGYIKMRPGDVGVYSFHINDAFQFQNNIRVVEETWVKEKPVWGSTAYWYALPAQPANSRQDFETHQLRSTDPYRQ